MLRIAILKAILKLQIRKIKTVEGLKVFSFNTWKVILISEVSLIIRFPIPKTAFGVDFFILLSPNLKKDFITIKAMRSYILNSFCNTNV